MIKLMDDTTWAFKVYRLAVNDKEMLDTTMSVFDKVGEEIPMEFKRSMDKAVINVIDSSNDYKRKKHTLFREIYKVKKREEEKNGSS